MKVSIESQTTALDEDDESSKDSLMDELAEVKSKVSFYKKYNINFYKYIFFQDTKENYKFGF